MNSVYGFHKNPFYVSKSYLLGRKMQNFGPKIIDLVCGKHNLWFMGQCNNKTININNRFISCELNIMINPTLN
jgi:hypothetical protein